MTKETEWQKRYQQLFERYAQPMNPDFEKDVLKLRTLGESLVKKDPAALGATPMDIFMFQYQFPHAMYDFMHIYITKGEVDYSLIRSGLYLVSELEDEAITNIGDSPSEGWKEYTRNGNFDEEGVFQSGMELKLVISADATNKQIVEFIRSNKEFIKQKQIAYRKEGELSGRIRPRTSQARNLEIKRLADEGYSHREIAESINAKYEDAELIYSDVASILKRLKSDN